MVIIIFAIIGSFTKQTIFGGEEEGQGGSHYNLGSYYNPVIIWVPILYSAPFCHYDSRFYSYLIMCSKPMVEIKLRELRKIWWKRGKANSSYIPSLSPCSFLLLNLWKKYVQLICLVYPRICILVIIQILVNSLWMHMCQELLLSW